MTPNTTWKWPRLSGFIATFLGLSIATVCLSACQSPSEKTIQGNTITLEIWTLQLNGFADTLEPMFRQFEAEHPGVKVKWVDVPFSEGEKRTLTAMMSGEVPDVVNLNPDFSAILANRNALVNMQTALPKAQQAEYLPVAWQAVTMNTPRHGQYTFGLPWYLTSSITFYNTRILQKAGWKKPPGTFEELEAFSKSLKNTGNPAQPTYAVMPTIAESGNFLKELSRIGIPLYDAQTGQAIFARHGAGDHLQYWVNAYQDQRVPKESITEGHRAAVNQYQSDALAMLLVGPSFIKILSENAQQTLNVTQVAPQFPQNATGVDFATMLLVVPIKSKHPKEAVELAQFITNTQNQLTLAQAAPVLPSTTLALKAPYFLKPSTHTLTDQARTLSARQLLQAKQAYQIRPEQRAINERMNYFVQAALLGKIEAHQAMDMAQSEINTQILRASPQG